VLVIKDLQAAASQTARCDRNTLDLSAMHQGQDLVRCTPRRRKVFDDNTSDLSGYRKAIECVSTECIKKEEWEMYRAYRKLPECPTS
jgi:hypothetical protein